ncbi:tetratricopeptide repeat protein [Ammonifex thiophilus]|uniref:Tetratricopeptide repeat protein n=1 Tax=Ammonifex thiophilus TaxID=444093 RepID=A0A3D8P602_9THEO|nr:tetratricopeptide repeat protein [Ammonifex thiophilus]RDV84744.1 tetratricopeptide repeat protein [Ammonifex thiophilus]
MIHFWGNPWTAVKHGLHQGFFLLTARLSEAVGAKRASLWFLEKLLGRFPRHRRLHLWAGRLCFQLGRLQRAFFHLLAAWPRLGEEELTGERIGTLAGNLPRRDAAWILATVGDYWRRKGEARRALSFFDRALALGCASAALLSSRGLCLLALGSVEEALRNFQEARLLGGRNAALSFNMAVALSRLGRYGEALRYYEEARRLGFGGAELHNNLGFCLYHLHRYQEAEFHFAEAYRLSSGDIEVGSNLAACYLKMGRAEEALRLLEKLQQRYPRDPVLLNNLAFALESCGRKEEALKLYQEAAELAGEGENHLYLLNLASCLVDLGRYAEALALCHRLAGKVNDRRLWSLRASISAELGEVPAATEYYRRALGLTG